MSKECKSTERLGTLQTLTVKERSLTGISYLIFLTNMVRIISLLNRGRNRISERLSDKLKTTRPRKGNSNPVFWIYTHGLFVRPWWPQKHWVMTYEVQSTARDYLGNDRGSIKHCLPWRNFQSREVKKVRDKFDAQSLKESNCNKDTPLADRAYK